MQTVTLTESQLRLLHNLLQDHFESGIYWGRRGDHTRLVVLTKKIIETALKVEEE